MSSGAGAGKGGGERDSAEGDIERPVKGRAGRLKRANAASVEKREGKPEQAAEKSSNRQVAARR